MRLFLILLLAASTCLAQDQRDLMSREFEQKLLNMQLTNQRKFNNTIKRNQLMRQKALLQVEKEIVEGTPAQIDAARRKLD